MKRILIAYYTQTGQLKSIVDSIVKNLASDDSYIIDYHKIEPISNFPFPWPEDEFYDVMPECVMGTPIGLKPFPFSQDDEYDLVFLAYQVWFLSPSIPFWSFLLDEDVASFLQGKKVITVLGVRNMWVNAHNQVQVRFKELGVNHIGNIVLADPNTNLVSVLTVMQYMLTGIKKPFKILPPYGVTPLKIEEASSFGDYIKEAFVADNFSDLQTKIVDNKGVFLKFPLRTTELAGGKIFKKWAQFVLAKGQAGNPARKGRLKIYKIYLLTLLFLISPISAFLFFLIDIIFRPFTRKSLRKTALLK